MIDLTHLKQVDPPNFVHVSDIEWYDGPLLSEFTLNDQVWVLSWCDNDKIRTNRYLAFRSSIEEVEFYKQSGQSPMEMLNLIQNGKEFLIVDISESGQTAFNIEKKDIPEEYFPVNADKL